MASRTFPRPAAWLLVSLLALLPATGLAEVVNIGVRVVKAEPATGTLEISLFNSAETFLKQPYLQTSGPVNEDGTYNALFAKVPPGEYAVAVVHDENDNGELDNGFLGLGGEGYAFSNDARPLFGRPAFERAKFTVEIDTSVEISLE
jgi:uncharacterized protein (DUF2141 family)